MITENIETIDKWNDLAKTLQEFDYYIFQMQYDIDMPEGFHVIFSCSGGSDYEVVTHSEAVYNSIMIKFCH